MEVFRFNNHVKVQTQHTFRVNTTNNPKKSHPNLFHFHICVLKVETHTSCRQSHNVFDNFTPNKKPISQTRDPKLLISFLNFVQDPPLLHLWSVL